MEAKMLMVRRVFLQTMRGFFLLRRLPERRYVVPRMGWIELLVRTLFWNRVNIGGLKGAEEAGGRLDKMMKVNVASVAILEAFMVPATSMWCTCECTVFQLTSSNSTAARSTIPSFLSFADSLHVMKNRIRDLDESHRIFTLSAFH